MKMIAYFASSGGSMTMSLPCCWSVTPRNKLREAICFALVDVSVYSLEVTENLSDWPERAERQRVWMSCEDAAVVVDEPGLSSILPLFRI